MFTQPAGVALDRVSSIHPEDQGPAQSVFAFTCLHFDEQLGEVREGTFQLRKTPVGVFFEQLFMGEILVQISVTRMTQTLPSDLQKAHRLVEARSHNKSLFCGCKGCKSQSLEPLLIEGTRGQRKLIFPNVQQTFELGVIAKHVGLPIEWE